MKQIVKDFLLKHSFIFDVTPEVRKQLENATSLYEEALQELE